MGKRGDQMRMKQWVTRLRKWKGTAAAAAVRTTTGCAAAMLSVIPAPPVGAIAHLLVAQP